MASLLVTTEEGKRFRYEIEAGSVRIGRSGRNELALTDLSVSRLHAEIVRYPRGFCVIDLGGKNGTFVNERRIVRPTLLHPQDAIRVGRTTLLYEGTTSGKVEFFESPLPKGPETTVLPAEELWRTGPHALTAPPTGEPTASGGEPGIAGAVITPVTPPAMPNPILSILSEADKELVFHHPIEQILDKIMDLAQRAVGFERGVLMLRGHEYRMRPVFRIPPEETEEKIRISRGILYHVLNNREVVLTSDALQDKRFRERESVIGAHIRSAMCVPLWNDERVIGFLYVDSRRDSGLFTREDLSVLAHLANVAAVKLENARLFEQEV